MVLISSANIFSDFWQLQSNFNALIDRIGFNENGEWARVSVQMSAHIHMHWILASDVATDATIAAKILCICFIPNDVIRMRTLDIDVYSHKFISAVRHMVCIQVNNKVRLSIGWYVFREIHRLCLFWQLYNFIKTFHGRHNQNMPGLYNL